MAHVHARYRHPLRAGLLALLLFTALASAGCQRRAPGPSECQQHALRVVVERVGPLTTPQAEQAYESEIARCLTTPYDRQLVRCVEERGPTRRCYEDFERRMRRDDSAELPNG